MSKSITLSDNSVALVDDEDFELANFYWAADNTSDTPSSQGYASRNIKIDGRWTSTSMHIEIAKRMGIWIKGLFVDHIDRNPRNNQRNNLRMATHSQQMRNRNKYRTNTSGIVGVTYRQKIGKWEARIGAGKFRRTLGIFYTKEDAEAARKQVEKDYGYND